MRKNVVEIGVDAFFFLESKCFQQTFTPFAFLGHEFFTLYSKIKGINPKSL